MKRTRIKKAKKYEKVEIRINVTKETSSESNNTLKNNYSIKINENEI